jgi:hypothetical protein
MRTAHRWLNTRRPPPDPIRDRRPRCRRELLAYRRTVFKAGDQAKPSLCREVRAAEAESGIPARVQFSLPRPNNSFIAASESPTIPTPTLLIKKPVVARFAAGDGLVVHIPRRFWHAGQEGLGQHIYECEQRLLS